MAVTCKVFVAPSVLAGNRLCKVAVFRDHGDHGIARLAVPDEGVPDQIGEHHGKIAVHSIDQRKDLPNRGG